MRSPYSSSFSVHSSSFICYDSGLPAARPFTSWFVKNMKIRRIVIPLALLSVLGLAVWSALAHDGEHHSPGGNGQPNDAPLAAMANMPCVNGMAGTFPCNKVDLAALL